MKPTWTVLDEHETMRRVRDERLSLARFGDGEIKLCRGGSCKTQTADPVLAKRLRNILKADEPRCLVAVPNIWGARETKPFWRSYRDGVNAQFYRPGAVYGSSFVSRPDSAPWINSDAYWGLVRSIWQDRSVVLVTGSKKGRQFLDSGMLSNASKVCAAVDVPRQNAWSAHDRLLDEASDMASVLVDPVVVLALGATSTVMAYELARRGIQALDLGHMGLFYREWLHGRTGTKPPELLSNEDAC